MVHINNLKIRNFKGIRSLDFNKFSSINFLTGESGVGKTSILHLISMLENPTSIMYIADLLEPKSFKYDMKDFKELICGNYNPDTNNGFSCVFNDKKLDLCVKMKKPGNISIRFFDKSADENLREITFNTFPISKSIHSKAYEMRAFRSKTLFDKLLVNDVNINTNFANILTHEKASKALLDVLRVSNPNFTKVGLSKKEKEIMVFDSKTNKNVPIDTLGKSIQKAVFLFSLIIASAGKVLVIEDWDTSFTQKVKKILFPAIKELVMDLDVQVFFTTYSEDTLAIMLESDNKDIMVHTLFFDGETNYVRSLSGKDAFHAYDSLGLSLI